MTPGAGGEIGSFVDAWVPELGRSIEMFTGVAVRAEAGTGAPPAAAAWHEQSFGDDRRIWIGLPADASALLSGQDEADDTLTHEVLEQSLQAAAQVLARGPLPDLRCAAGHTTSAPPDAAPSLPVVVHRPEGGPVSLVLRWNDAFARLFAGLSEPAAAPVLVADLEADATAGSVPPPAFDRFVGVELPVAVVLGRASLRVREVLKLTVGSLVELDARPDEPVDICVHNTVVARGEVVAVRGNYGVRVLEVMSPQARLDLRERSRRHTLSSRPSVH